ncbi:elongation factor Ts [Luteolibacter ambystomatis]|uniref:Elongation factor Ts n=1 Tax=Luteolibacter ambystomatis TaxID=2824561 RepID=A0A975G7D2_9BACT|nr:translation elongation factor Ts [Luteolibacter ambystomatis]QUE50689.1 elongation factor Ts [Luteolibacter ambystomatis]
MITASLVNDLRKKTNAGMMDCKRALEETQGDLEAAAKLLREKGIVKASSKADRAANEGIITARLSENGKSGILLEVNCETDFVSRNDNFQGFVNGLADTLIASSAADLDAAQQVSFLGAPVEETVKAKIAEVGENLQFRKYVRFDAAGEGAVSSYIHMGGKVGVLIEVGAGNAETASTAGFRELVKDLTLHIAAAAPRGLSREDIPADVVEAEKDIFRAQLADSGKPANIIENIINGKIAKYFAESCFLEQGFVKDPDTSITKLLEAKGKELGDTLTVRRFVRFGLGE